MLTPHPHPTHYPMQQTHHRARQAPGAAPTRLLLAPRASCCCTVPQGLRSAATPGRRHPPVGADLIPIPNDGNVKPLAYKAWEIVWSPVLGLHAPIQGQNLQPRVGGWWGGGVQR